MANSCSNCFYVVTDPIGVMHCHRQAPEATDVWPVVLASDWCGDGYDNVAGKPMMPTSVQASGSAQPVWIAPNPNPGGTLTHLTGSAGGSSTLVRTGAGWITGISVNAVATGSATMTCYDGLNATGTVIAVIDVSRSNPSPQTAAPWGFQTGFFVVLSNGTTGADVTIVSHSV